MSNQYIYTEVSSDDKLWAALAWIFSPWVSLIIMLFMQDKKDRPWLKNHYMQALGLGVVLIVLSIIAVGICLWPFIFIYQLYLAYKAYQGETVQVPVLTDFMKGQGWLS